ncbi:MAG: thiamine-phosphate synthase family protein [Sulfolobales archaeon]
MSILLRYGIDINDDRCFINPAVYIEIPAAKYEAIENVRKAVEILLENQNLVLPYTPEVGINVAEAIKPMYVFSINDVAGVEGRIVKAGNRLIKVGEIKMGGSSHLARLLIALIRRGYSLRGAINVRFDKSLVEKAVRKGYKVVFIDRRKEPEEIKDAPTGTMEWIASQISGEIPDLIYDIGDIGKEPMIRILGDNSIRAVEKLIRILSDQ